MKVRITMIENSRETQVKFLESLPTNETVELQPVTTAPFFDEKIEQAIIDFHPDLIILDLLLHRDIESGFRVLRKIKESNSLKDIPVVVCSKFIGEDREDKNKKRALESGAVAAL